jgi:membrane-bound serine protease (ClpP class)
MPHRRLICACLCLWLLQLAPPAGAEQGTAQGAVQDQRTTDTSIFGKMERGLNIADDILGNAVDKGREAVQELRDAAEGSGERKQPERQEAQPAAEDKATTSTLPKSVPLIIKKPADIVYPKPTSSPLVVHVVLEGMVAPTMRMTVHKAIEEAKAQEASLILLEMDTPGGLVSDAGLIKKYLFASPITTAIWVNDGAYSAGALISLSCDNIFMHTASEIGAATPYTISLTGASTGEDPDVKEKMLSAVVTEFEAAAEAKGHRKDLAAAFVDRQQEIPGLIERGKLLTLTSEEAVKEGLAIAVVNSPEEIFRMLRLENPRVVSSQLTTREKFAMAISTYAFVLLGLGLVGIFFEIKSPGFGVPGIMGLFCLGLFFWASFVTLNTSWFEIILFFAGVILLVLEITVIPGFGVAGVAGIVCVMLSFFLSMFEMPAGDYQVSWAVLQAPVMNTMLTLVVGSILMLFALRFFHQTPFWRRIELGNTLAADQGFVSSASQEKLIGTVGVAATVLRPAGIVTINRVRKDAMSQGDYIEKGAKVRVIGIDGAQLLVEEVK